MGNSGLQPGDVDEYGKRPGGDASCRFIKCSSTCPNPTTNWPDKPADRAPSVRPAICGYASEKRKLLITPHVAKRNVGHRTAKQTQLRRCAPHLPSPIFHFSFLIFDSSHHLRPAASGSRKNCAESRDSATKRPHLISRSALDAREEKTYTI